MKDRYALRAEAPKRPVIAIFALRRGQFEEHLNQGRRFESVVGEVLTTEEELRLAIECDEYVWSLPAPKEDQ